MQVDAAKVWTYRHSIDKEHNKDDDKQQDDCSDEVPLVVTPDDVTQGLQRRREPQEWRLGAARKEQHSRDGINIISVTILAASYWDYKTAIRGMFTLQQSKGKVHTDCVLYKLQRSSSTYTECLIIMDYINELSNQPMQKGKINRRNARPKNN